MENIIYRTKAKKKSKEGGAYILLVTMFLITTLTTPKTKIYKDGPIGTLQLPPSQGQSIERVLRKTK